MQRIGWEKDFFVELITHETADVKIKFIAREAV
jgi:hypothetical protein